MTARILSYTRAIRAMYGYEKAAYFLVYALLHRRAFGAWLDVIETGAFASFPDPIKTRLAMRAAFRFLRAWLPLTARIENLTRHFSAIVKRFSAEGVENLCPRGGIDVATLTGKSGKLYVIRMMSEVAKEGALRISLFDPEAERGRLASITGVLGCDSKGKSCFWIGALQGAVADGKQAVVAVTKDLNGLRPKQAVLQAAAVVCLWFGVEEMVGPSLGNQVADKTRTKAQKIHTEYDEFWQEFTGGATDERGDYILSLPLPRRKLEEVQQKRRKDWTLRYARVDAMKAEIEDCLKKL